MDTDALTTAFETVYRDGRWGTGLGSGHGSRPWATIIYRRFLESFLATNGIRSVIDYGCGDWALGQLIDWRQVQYTGLDVVPHLIAANQERFGSDHIRFMVTPSDSQKIPEADLLIVKDVLQHLPLAAITEVLTEVVPRCQMTLIIDDQPGDAGNTNTEIAPGDWRRVDVRRPPFDQPATVIRTLLMLPAITGTLQRMRAGRKTVMLIRR